MLHKVSKEVPNQWLLYASRWTISVYIGSSLGGSCLTFKTAENPDNFFNLGFIEKQDIQSNT